MEYKPQSTKPLENLYKWGDKINKWLKKAKSIPKTKVISIGNITTGGTGKTPTVMFISQLLKNEDYNIGVLSRGYGGSKMGEGAILSDGNIIYLTSKESGDEPLMIAVNSPSVPIAIGRNRYNMGKQLKKQCNTNLFILDDGFQHYSLHRDVDIVLVDATNPFGNGHTLPHGILREPIESLKRADIIILTKTDLALSNEIEELINYIKKLSGHEIIFKAIHKPISLIKLPIEYNIDFNTNKKTENLKTIKNETVWALSGIANHKSFENTLLNLGVSEVKNISFRDHHDYSEKDIESILKRVSPYEYLITTEKDWVRLKKYKNHFKNLHNFFILKIEFQLINNEVLFKEGLKAKILTGKLDKQ